MLRRLMLLWIGLLLQGVVLGPASDSQRIRVEDFETYPVGSYPSRWKFLTSKREFRPLEAVMNEREECRVQAEANNQFLRCTTQGEAQRITLANRDDFGLNWDLRTHPTLRWRWRAVHLPANAREDRRRWNDSGGAVYVTFGFDWLGRPISIKYTYSSLLPRETVVDFGPLKVIVASSGREGFGRWITVERDVAADYRRVFGKEPPARPLSITIWSDSDNTRDYAIVDFDDFELLPAATVR
ncbi:DUF3047 domain-containing protein [Rhodothermus profundi]|uniref:DUF3047 domain-containing protein n=1 Tax=Rhodothermus profundi TaxID=633813 RepID=A0A1M6RCR9_9BACT|nr:DUF3047 domain-containing protein [Rhodothermus profundi]SHK30264.1 Protein of unknown function [Rhodothermus profundi]